MKIKKVKINKTDLIANYLPANYVDSFEYVFNTNSKISADDSSDETVISANDKHLKMYFSVKTAKINERQQKLSVTTVVHFHNLLGRTYFFIIYPFHHFIAPSMIKYSMKKLLFI